MSKLWQHLFVVSLFVCTMYFPLNIVQADWLQNCGDCRCKWNSGKKTADCKNANIQNVPMNLSSEVQVLDMSLNRITEIPNSQFLTINLRNLHKLYMRNCSMRIINRDSFLGLEIVIELDLSGNLLKKLPRNAFGKLVKLRVLMLKNNQLEHLDDHFFYSMGYLHKVELKENRIMRVEPKAFTNLPLLTHIYLDGNKLTNLRYECFERLPKLTSLSLTLNQWNCTCELKPFRDYAIKHKLYTPPTDCFYPASARGKLWNDESINSFACKPEILFPLSLSSVSSGSGGDSLSPSIGTTAISSGSGENVTLSCRISTSGNTIVMWTFNKHSLSLNNYPKRIFIKTVSVANADNSMETLTTELNIINVKKGDEVTYTCGSKNAGGRAEVDIILKIELKSNENQFISNNILLVLCLMAVGLLVVSLIIMALTCCYCRKFKKLTKQDLDNKKQFEAIKLNSFNNATTLSNGTDFEMQKQQFHSQHQTVDGGEGVGTSGSNGGGSDCGMGVENHQLHVLQQDQQLLQIHPTINHLQKQQKQQQAPHHEPSSINDFSNSSSCSNYTEEKTDIIGNDTRDIKCVLFGETFVSGNFFLLSLYF